MPGPVIAFFDIDNTLVRGATVYFVGFGAWRLRLLTLRDVAVFAWQQARFISVGENMKHTESIKTRTLAMLRGHTEEELERLGEDVYDRQIMQRLWPEVVAKADDHLARGHQVWLISATGDIVAQVIARRLGLTGALGTRFEAVNGVFTGRLEGGMVHGPEKAVAARRLASEAGADLAECWAYSDSANDLPLLGTVGHPVAVNPDDALRAEARARAWPVMQLRRRKSRPVDDTGPATTNTATATATGTHKKRQA
ncbi:HAD family phosphatase [Subtercola sp. Z020]|uniref:HAD family hydrolase n=1 Tax=Subtercola sp. Z020 TaxID=2080582 RepID=UPI00130E5408|nr:HAD family hydrolase [Subtercola sp. Z020]